MIVSWLAGRLIVPIDENNRRVKMKLTGTIGENRRLNAGWAVLIAFTAVLFLPSLVEPAKLKSSYTHSYCNGKRPCGAIVYGNAGGYVVTSVVLKSKSDQPDAGTPTQDHPDTGSPCSGIDVKFDSDTSLGQYDQFVVPASCAYNLKINIVAGPKKDRNLFLTPACVIKTKTDGTTTSNEWHVSASWIKGKKPEGASSHPLDSHGHKCGRLKKSGT